MCQGLLLEPGDGAGDPLLAAPPQAAPRFGRWLRQERNMEAIPNMLGNLLRHLGN